METIRKQELEILKKGGNITLNFIIDKYKLDINHIDIVFHRYKKEIRNNIVLLSYFDKKLKVYRSYILA